ncbi:MAG: SWIM zinc finger family protein, partial [Oceanococcaceae bacterium]
MAILLWMNRSDILRAFNRLTYHRGERYFREGRVRSLRAEPVAGGVLQVTSVTEGEQSYTQKIEVRDDGRRVLVSGDCSCPVGFNCKHVVASCLALAQEMASGEGVFGQSRTERWLEALTEAASAPAPPRSAPHLKPRFMTYVLDAPSLQTLSAGDNVLRDGVQIQLRVTRERASGSGLNKGTNVSPDTLRYTVELDEALDDSDRLLIPLLTARRRFYSGGPLILDQDSPSETLDRLLASNRAYWKSLDGPRLTRGEPRPLHLHWEPQGNEYRLQAQVMPDALILLLRQPWYLDIGRAEIGPLTTETAVRDAQWPLLFDAPPCSADEAMQVSQRLLAGNVRLPVPPPLRLEVEEIRDTPLTPVLRLLGFDDDMDQATRAHAAELRFRYGDAVVDPLPDTALSTVTIGSSRLVRVHRDSAAEEDAAAALHDIGMSELDNDNGPRPFVVRAD